MENDHEVCLLVGGERFVGESVLVKLYARSYLVTMADGTRVSLDPGTSQPAI